MILIRIYTDINKEVAILKDFEYEYFGENINTNNRELLKDIINEKYNK